MRFFLLSDILTALLLSAILGSVLGIIYKSGEKIIYFADKLFMLFPDVYRNLSAGFSFKKLIDIKTNDKQNLSLVQRTVFDFIFFSIFGASVILLIYISLDGVFRFYPILTVILFFTLSNKFCGFVSSRIFDKLLSIIYTLIFICGNILMLPVFKALLSVYKLLKKLLTPIEKRIEYYKFKRIKIKKITKVENFFGNSYK